jgi:hypothetical protein
MTRFKEKRRIDAAIKNGDLDELKWALQYCQMRLRLSSIAHHEKYWRKEIKIVEDAINEVEMNGRP